MCQLRVDFLRHDAVAVHQVLWLVVEKTRIGTQEFSEVMEAAFEPGGRDDFIHLRPDALYFGETDFVNLLRRQVRRRLPADMERVAAAPFGSAVAAMDSRHAGKYVIVK